MQWPAISNSLDRWFGTSNVGSGHPSSTVKQRLASFPTDEVLDTLEASFAVLAKEPNPSTQSGQQGETLVFFTNHLNKLFLEYDLAYQLVDGKITPLDSHFVHSEIVAPAVSLLHNAGFEAANAEFMLAHEHYRHGDYEPAINEAAKAVESTIRLICRARAWSYDPSSKMRQLVAILKSNGLFPAYLEDMTNNLAKIIETAPASIRNNQAPHSRADRDSADRDLAMFALHLSASCIVFRVKRHQAMLS